MGNTVSTQKKMRRSQLYMLVTLFCILIVTGLLFLSMKQISHQRASEHKHSFMEYITVNKIGTLKEIDSGTGLDPMSYIVTINHAVPDQDLETFATNLIQRYVMYDRGQILSVVYVNGQTGKQVPVAEANYNDDEHILTLTLTFQSGQMKKIIKNVDW